MGVLETLFMMQFIMEKGRMHLYRRQRRWCAIGRELDSIFRTLYHVSAAYGWHIGGIAW